MLPCRPEYERKGPAVPSLRLCGQGTAGAAKRDPCCRPVQSHRIDEVLTVDEDSGMI